MKSRANKLAIATAAGFSILWVICSLFVVLVPKASMGLTGMMVHADLSSMNWSLTWGSFFIGLIGWAILGALTAWLIVFIYNIFDCLSTDNSSLKRSGG